MLSVTTGEPIWRLSPDAERTVGAADNAIERSELAYKALPEGSRVFFFAVAAASGWNTL